MGVNERSKIRALKSDLHLRADVLIRMKFTFGEFQLDMDYIPDRLLFIKESFNDWISGYKNWDKSNESLAINLLDDINNEIVPRWAMVTLSVKGQDEKIIAEDKQPGWSSRNNLTKIPLGGKL